MNHQSINIFRRIQKLLIWQQERTFEVMNNKRENLLIIPITDIWHFFHTILSLTIWSFIYLHHVGLSDWKGEANLTEFGVGGRGVSDCCYGVFWWVKHVKAPCPALESLLMDDAEEAALDRPSGGSRPFSNQHSEKSDSGDDGCAKRCYRTFHEDRG